MKKNKDVISIIREGRTVQVAHLVKNEYEVVIKSLEKFVFSDLKSDDEINIGIDDSETIEEETNLDNALETDINDLLNSEEDDFVVGDDSLKESKKIENNDDIRFHQFLLNFPLDKADIVLNVNKEEFNFVELETEAKPEKILKE
ncbi:MAG: hypothetical protein U9N34_00620, partial [Candidatus Cloacimonadota bacterium]|nr:hypothetical protein [Candidatus Cloacimonadota bacterium]